MNYHQAISLLKILKYLEKNIWGNRVKDPESGSAHRHFPSRTQNNDCRSEGDEYGTKRNS